MAENPKAEALQHNIAFIQESMATGGLSTIASHLLQLDLITRQNYRDSLTPCGRGPDDQAAMLMRTVESRIRNSPDVYFTRFIEALRRSNLGYVADRLVKALEETEDQRHSSCTCKWSQVISYGIKPKSILNHYTLEGGALEAYGSIVSRARCHYVWSMRL